MEPSAQEMVERIHSALAEGRILGELIDPEAEYHNPPDAIEPGVRVGRNAVIAFETIGLPSPIEEQLQ